MTSKSDSSRFFALDGQFFRSLRSLEPILCFRDTIQSFFFFLCLPDITISLIYIGIPSDVSGCFLIGFYIRINFLQPHVQGLFTRFERSGLETTFDQSTFETRSFEDTFGTYGRQVKRYVFPKRRNSEDLIGTSLSFAASAALGLA